MMSTPSTLRLRPEPFAADQTLRISCPVTVRAFPTLAPTVPTARVAADAAILACLNCSGRLIGDFCHRCGQAAKTPARITFGAIVRELPHAILHLDHALPHTIVALLHRPGHTIRNYLQGKRAHIYSPFALLFLVSGLLGLVAMTLKLSGPVIATSHGVAQTLSLALQKNQAWVRLALVPIQAVGPTLVLRRRTGLGYGEQVIAAAMATAGSVMLSLVGLPFQWLARGTAASPYVSVGLELLTTFYVLWAYAQLQDDGKHGGAVRRGLWSVAAMLGSAAVIVGLVVVLGVAILVVVVGGVALAKARA